MTRSQRCDSRAGHLLFRALTAGPIGITHGETIGTPSLSSTHGEREEVTVTDLITQHLAWLARGDIHHRPRAPRTVEGRAITLRHADRDLPDGLARASGNELDAWFRPYRKVGKEWTLSTHDTALRVFYNWATATGKIDINPMDSIGRPAPGPRDPHPCEDHELARALTAPRWPWRRAVLLAAYAGLRCTELCTVTTTDIVGDRLRILGKGRKVRHVPIGPVLAEELAGTPPGHLLVGARGLPIDGRVLTGMQRPVWAALGLPGDFSLHSLRHWFITKLLENGATMPEAARLAGHSSVATTQGYAGVVDARLTADVRRLPRVTEPGSDRLGDPSAA